MQVALLTLLRPFQDESGRSMRTDLDLLDREGLRHGPPSHRTDAPAPGRDTLE